MTAFLYLRVDFIKSGSIGPHRAGLLEGIKRLGSISATARVIGMTTRQTWTNVQRLNEMYPHPVIATKPGPKGGATLTAFGMQVLRLYRTMERDANRSLEKHLEAFHRLMGEDANTPVAVPKDEAVVLWSDISGEGRAPSQSRAEKRAAAEHGRSRRPAAGTNSGKGSVR